MNNHDLNTNEQKNKNVKHINIAIIVVILFGVLAIASILYLVMSDGNNDDEVSDNKNNYEEVVVSTDLKEINQDIEILIGAFNQLLTVNTFETTTTNFGYKNSRISLTFKNNKDIDNRTSSHTYELLDSNGNKLSSCYNNIELLSPDAENLLPIQLPAQSTIDGYVYCEVYSGEAARFQITVISGGRIFEDNTFEDYYEYYYVDLK